MPRSFSSFLASFDPQPPRTEAEASLARINQLLGPTGGSPTPVQDYASRAWDTIFTAPEFIRRPARRFADWLTEPTEADQDSDQYVRAGLRGALGPASMWMLDKALGGEDNTAARIKGLVGGSVEGGAELLSPFNVATTVAGVGPVASRLPSAVAAAARAGGIVGGGAIAGQSIAALTDAATNYDDADWKETALAVGNAGIGLAAGLGSAFHVPPGKPTFRGQDVSAPVGPHNVYPRSRNTTPPAYRDPWALERTNRVQFTEGDFYEPGPTPELPPGRDPRLLAEGDFGNQMGPGPTPLGPSPAGGPPRSPFSPGGPFVGGIPDEGMAPAPINAPPSIRGLLEAQAGPSRTAGGGIEAPGEIGSGWAPWMRGDEPPAPPPANRPQGPAPRPSSPDTALQDEAIQAFMQGDVQRGLELASEARTRQWYDDNWFQLPPEGEQQAPPPPLPAPLRLPKPVVTSWGHVGEVAFLDADNVQLTMLNGNKMKVPTQLARELIPGLPEPPAPPPPTRDRFDIYPPEQRDAMRARVAEIEAMLRPEQGQQGLEFQGPVVGEQPGRPLSPLDELEQRLSRRTATIPEGLEPTTPRPSQGPLPLPAPENVPSRTFAPPAGPLTAAPEAARPVAPLGTVGAPPAEVPPSPPAPVQRPATPAERSIAQKPAGPGMVPPEERMNAEDLTLDPQTFQFKESDQAGVTGALKGVQQWDDSAPPLQVFETLDGRRFVADGHQRYNKYRELQARGDELPPLKVRVWREADGFTVQDMVRLASLRNIQEGSAQPLDIARLIWNGGALTPDEGARVPKSQVVGDRLARGQALGSITDPRARQMLINHEVDQNYASFVGKYIADPAEQLSALQKLAKADLDNLRQAEAFVKSLAEQEFVQIGLDDIFGGQDVAVPLAETKAKLMDDARRALGQRKAAFAGAINHADELVAAGNQLLSDINVANLTAAKKLAVYFDKFADKKGTFTNAALNDAARALVRDGGDRATHLAAILEAVKRDLETGGGAGGAASAAAVPPAGAEPPVVAGRPGQPPGGAGEGPAAPTGLGQLLGVEEPPAPPPPPPPPQKVAEAMPPPPPPPGGGGDRSPLWRGMRQAAERDLAGGDIAAFNTGELKELTDRLGVGYGELKRMAVSGELDPGRPEVQAALDAIASARETARPAMKQAQQGEFLAPPDKDYVFVRLPEEFAHSPEGAAVRKALTNAGYRFRNGQRAWFKNAGEMTPEQLEAEAAELLGGVRQSEAPVESRPASPVESTPEAPVHINEFGEAEPQIPGLQGEAPKTDAGLVAREELFGKLQKAATQRTGIPQQQALDSIKPLKTELLARLEGVQDDTLRLLRPYATPDEAARIDAELVRRGLAEKPPTQSGMFGEEPPAPPAKPADLGELLTGEAAKPTLPSKPIAEVPPAAEGAPTMQQLPPNVRSFLTRQLGYSPDDINAMGVDEAMQIGRDRVSKPLPPAAEPESPVEAPPPPKAAVAPTPVPTTAAGGGRAPQSLEELLTGYIEKVAPTKIEQTQRRMGEARAKAGAAKVPVRQTYRGGAPEEDAMAVPAREAKPYQARTLTEANARKAAGIDPEAYEAQLEAEAPAKGELRKRLVEQRPKEALTEQERKARGLPPVKRGEAEGATKHKDALNKGGLTRANAKRAYAMERLLKDGSPDSINEYGRALTEQVARENEQALKWGAAETQEGQKKWGDEFTRLKPDKETGEYLGSGFAPLQKLWDQDPALVIRTAGGALLGLILGKEDTFDKQIASALLGGAAGAVLSPKLARALYQAAKTQMPRITQSVETQWKNAKKPSSEWDLHVRTPRDYSKDIGFFQQARSITAVDPDLFYDLFNIAKERAKAITPNMTPEMRRVVSKMYDREARAQVSAAAKIAERQGHTREARYLRYYHDMLAGKPSWIAEAMSSGTLGTITPRQAEKMIVQANRQVYRALIGFAVDTALVNRTQVALALPKIGIKGVAKGIAEGRTKSGKQAAEAAGMHWDQLTDLPETAQSELMSAIDEAAFGMMHWSDEANRADVYLGARKWARGRGYTADQAERFAVDLTMQTQGIPGDLAGNPYIHHFAGPLRALAKYPTMWGEFAADVLTHPDKRVAGRAIAYLVGAAALGAKAGVDVYDILVPRMSFVGPAAGVLASLPEEIKHLPGGEQPTHSILEDISGAAVPRYAKKVAGVVKARTPESMGGYGEGMGERPVIDRRGKDTGDTRSALEDVGNLLGVRSTRQTDTQKERAQQYQFEREARQERQVASDAAYRKLRDAIERNDEQAIRAAEDLLSPTQLRSFYRDAYRPTRERIERRLSKEHRERFREQFGAHP